MANPPGLQSFIDNLGQVNNAYILANWPSNPAADNVIAYEARLWKTNGDDSGNATGVGATSLTDTGKAWTASSLGGSFVTMGGAWAQISDNTATGLTLVGWTDFNGNTVATPAAGAYQIVHFMQRRVFDTQVKFDALWQGVSYSIALRAINNLGTPSAWSAVRSISTAIDSVAPTWPGGAVLTATSALRGVNLSWPSATAGGANPDFRGYTLQVATDAGFTQNVQTLLDRADTTQAYFQAPGGTAIGTTYYFRVSPYDQSGNQGAWISASATVGGMVNADITPGAISAADLALTIGGGNLVANSSFEDQAAYAPFSIGWDATWAADTTVAWDGGTSAKVTYPNTTHQNMFLFGINNPPIDAALKTVASVWVKAPAGTLMNIRNRWQTPAGGYIGEDAGANFTATGGWQRVFSPANSAANAVSGTTGNVVAHGSIGQAGANQTAFIANLDAVQVEIGDTPTAYAPRANELTTGVIQTAMLAANAVTNAKLAANAVQQANIAAGAVGTSQIAANAVTSGLLAAGAVTSAALAANAVTSAALASGAVTATAIAAGAVGNTALAANAVDQSKLANGAVGTAQLINGAVTNAILAANAVAAANIQNGAVGTAAIANAAITSVLIATGAVTSQALAANAVTQAAIAAGAVTNAQLAAAAVQAGNLAVTLGGGNLVPNSGFEYTTLTDAAYGAMFANVLTATSDATYAHSGSRSLRIHYGGAGDNYALHYFGSGGPAVALANQKVTLSFWARSQTATANGVGISLQDAVGNYLTPITANITTTWQRFIGTVTLPSNWSESSTWMGHIVWRSSGDATNDLFFDDVQLEVGDVATAYAPATAEILPNTVGTAMIQANAITAAKIAANTITASQIAAATITSAQIAAGTIQASNIAAGTITGDRIAAGTITGSLIAATTISASNIVANTITAAQIAANTITAAQIAAGTITAAQIAAATITGGLIAAATITGSNLVAGTITASQIAAGTITGSLITAATITGSLIAANTISASNIVAGTITSNELAANSVTATQIAASAVTTAKIAAGAITAGTIAAGAVGASQIAAGAVTTDKLSVGSVGQENLVPNGSFEDISGTMPVNWTQAGSANGSAVSTTAAANVKSGAAALGLQVTVAGAGNNVYVDSASFPVTPGDNLYVSGWVLGSVATTSGFYLRVSFGSSAPVAGDGTYSDVSANSAVATSWGQFQALVAVPAGMTWAKVRLINYQPNVACTMYVDAIEVRKAIGSAQILNASILTAHIANAAITNAKISDLVADKITGGTISAAVLISGSIQTAASGARAGMSNVGFFTSDGTATDYGAGAGITFQATNGGAAFLKGNIHASGVQGSYFFATSADTNVPTLPTPPTGNGVGSLMVDPTNGFRIWLGNGTVANQIAKFGMDGTITIYSGATIYGSTIASDPLWGQASDQSSNFVLNATKGLAFYPATASTPLWNVDPATGDTIMGFYTVAGPKGGTYSGALIWSDNGTANAGHAIGKLQIFTDGPTGVNYLDVSAPWVYVEGGFKINPSAAYNYQGNVPIVLANGRFASQTSITFSSIPLGFRAIKILWNVYPGVAAGDIYVRFNGDTTASYDWALMEAAAGGAPAGYSGNAVTYARVGYVANWAAGEVTIPGYATGVGKAFIATCSRWDSAGTAGAVIDHFSDYWNSGGAITSITFGIAGGGNLGPYGDYTVLAIP